jgi:hypothetical protein
MCMPATRRFGTSKMAMAVFACALILFCPVIAASSVFPDGNWVEMTPESQGVNPQKLEEALSYLESKSGADGLKETVVIRNGYMIWKGDNIDTKHDTKSVGKIFTSTVFGLLIDNGVCSPATRAREFAPVLEEHYGAVLLEDFATMTSGYDAVGGSYSGGGLDSSSTPWVPTAPLFSPGEAYLYWDDAAGMFGYILTQAAREAMVDLFWRRVGTPIGINPKGFKWLDFGVVDGYLLNYGAKGVFVSARELAKVGLLYLHKGMWNGRRILSSSFVESATKNQVSSSIPMFRDINPDPNKYTSHMDVDGRGVYGYHWWVNGVRADGSRALPDAPRDTFWRSGANHNHLVVIPSWDMVIVRLGTDGSPPDRDAIWNTFLRMVGEALTDSGLSVVGFTLVDADSDSVVGPLTDGDVVRLDSLPFSLNLRADTSPGIVGSVRFDLDGDIGFSIDNGSPYTLAGDDNDADYFRWDLQPGTHSVTATPFPESGGNGQAGTPMTITFEIVEDVGNSAPIARDDTAQTTMGEPVVIPVLDNDSDHDGSLVPSSVKITRPPASGQTTVDPVTGEIRYTPDAGFSGVESFSYTVEDDQGAVSNVGNVTVTVQEGSIAVLRLILVDADSDLDIGPLGQGDTVDFTAIGTTRVNIRAETDPEIVGSVRFALDGNDNFRTESAAPYYLAGDKNGDVYPWTPEEGSHTLTATPFTGAKGTGTAGIPLTIAFEVIEGQGGSPPVANAGPDQNLTDSDDDGFEEVILDGSASTAEGTIQSFEWFRGSDLLGTESTIVVTLPVGSHTITLSVTDDRGRVDSDQVVIVIEAQPGTVNVPPTARDDTAQASMGEPVVIPVLDNDSDQDGSLVPSSVVITGSASSGQTVVNPASGAVTYTPDPGFIGTDSFSYTVEDDQGAVSNQASVIVTVTEESLAVLRFILVNADTGADIGPLLDGGMIDFSDAGTRRLNIRAETVPEIVGSVRFGLDGKNNYRTENDAPYYLAGDKKGVPSPWTPQVGSHTLKATPYSEARAKGIAGTALSITFQVQD